MRETKPLSIKHYLPYIALLMVVGGGIWIILIAGSRIYSGRQDSPSSPVSAETQTASEPSVQAQAERSYASRAFENFRNSLSILLLQLVVIIIAARLVGKLFSELGQPPVLGEIVAGILLGPSLLGLISPRTMEFLFPASSLEPLRLLSQIGVALFMFVVGMELDLAHLRKKAQSAIMVSNASIIVPFFLGAALALILFPALAPPTVRFLPFALFMGIAMSITAFPVLARILEDRGLSQTSLGTIALTCAAVDDVTAWCVLALVIAIAQSGGVAASLVTIALTLAFIGVMLILVRRLLARLLSAGANRTELSPALVGGILAFAFACALLTEAIGIHALFGAFLAGVVMPSAAGPRVVLKEKLGGFSAAALLPLFFAFTGLRMQMGLLNDWQSWLMCAVIILVAISESWAPAC